MKLDNPYCHFEDVEEYQTVPGIITVIMRIIVMICFVAALRDTMAHEFNSEKLNFFLHFGAASLVWFNYLPILSLVALQVISNEIDGLFYQLS